MDAHSYTPLPPRRGMIRLLRLFKGFQTDVIQCELFQTTLSEQESVTYEALSYTWGSDDSNLDDVFIKDGIDRLALKDTKKAIGKNLHTALRYLRTTTRDRILWVDAICIDQSNEKEKTDQIGQMRLVYQNAEQVLIWLEQSNEDIDKIMDAMANLHKEASIDHKRWKCPAKRLEIAGPIFRQQSGDITGNYYLKQLDGLRQLLDRAWFHRVWIIQEVASARAATIICGSKSVHSDTFALTPSLLGVEVDSHVQAVLQILPGQSRKDSWWSDRRDLHFLLNKFSRSQAKDDRDKVFALLGITSDAFNPETFKPDYGHSLEEVRRDILCFLLLKRVLPSWMIKLPDIHPKTLLSYLDRLPELADLVLQWTIVHRHQLTSAFLLEVGGYTAPRGTISYLLEYTSDGNESLTSYYLSHKATDNIEVNGSRETALNIAARKGNEKAVALLLGRSRIDLDHEDVHGITPLAAAIIHGKPSAAKLLLDKGSKIDMTHRDVDGITPLMAAVIHGNHVVLELLLAKRQVDMNNLGLLGTTPLSIATILGHSRVVKILQADKELGVLDIPRGRRLVEVRRNLLTIMARDDDAAGLEALIKDGVSFSFTDEHGRTLLARAAMAGAVSTTKALTGRLPVDYQDVMGRTPVSLAAEMGHQEVCDHLMRCGADISVKDRDGKSALDWAYDRAELESRWNHVTKTLFEMFAPEKIPTFSDGKVSTFLKAMLFCEVNKKSVADAFDRDFYRWTKTL